MALTFVEKAQRRLERLWLRVKRVGAPDKLEQISPEIAQAVYESINSRMKSYRYVLPTQLLAKLVDPRLDCRILQEGAGVAGSFDARSFCKFVISKFDAENHNVLGGSGDPYVSNPLRYATLSEMVAAARRDQVGARTLSFVAEFAQRHPEQIEAILLHILFAIKQRLALTHIVYPVPNRVSVRVCLEALREFLNARTGGSRMQAVAVGLFETVGERLGLFKNVRSENINAADSQTGQAADLECVDEAGKIVLAVEVKDRQLTLRMVEEKLPRVRERGVSELLFLVQGGVEGQDQTPIDELVGREFATGQNVYVSEFEEFVRAAMIFFGEAGRRAFLLKIGEHLDFSKAELTDREQWRDILASI